MLAPQISMRERMAMYNANALKIGLFGPNCSSGRAVTRVPERWSGSWPDNLRLARMADDAGIDFLLPIARWKGYGGDTDYQGATWETVTWASGLLASTKKITVCGTVHAPLFNPIIAAKEFVTADHIGEGRFGLNLVVGWNEDEFDMFGVKQREHDQRYEYAEEWVEVMKLAWSEREDFDFAGRYFNLKAIRAKPKPFGGTRPLMMNAGASDIGRSFALRNCDAFFTNAKSRARDETQAKVRAIKAEAARHGREIDVYTVGVVTCRPTIADAEAYYRHCVVENADWSAVDLILAKKNITVENHAPEEFQRARNGYAQGMGGFPVVGDPDEVANILAELSATGLRGIGISFVNYADELPYFCDEVLPRLKRMGVRA
ncbi:MAG TPA: LLM class flavin-dependent oxidoreductase [Xanthobacteraceae bacterium]|nr:LLM class flavin-dependent oxidoreductase [Xanthobacteraceae bacterium]